jgi:hypothetical protein
MKLLPRSEGSICVLNLVKLDRRHLGPGRHAGLQLCNQLHPPYQLWHPLTLVP